MKPKAPDMGEEVKGWYRLVWRTLKSSYAKTDSVRRQDVIARLAGYLTLVGPIGDPDARKLFTAFKLLYPRSSRARRWYGATELLPADRDALLSFADLINSYEELASQGHTESLLTGKVNLENTVYYALKFSNKKQAFLAAVKESWMTYPAVIFSERLVRESSQTLRGAFGDFADENYEADLDDVEVIE